MSVRESFLTVNESLAAAPGPGHYAPGFAFHKVKGGGSLDSRVCVIVQLYQCVPMVLYYDSCRLNGSLILLQELLVRVLTAFPSLQTG